MKLIFPNAKETVLFLMRRAGYGFERKIETGEEAFSKRISINQYPKFHAYAKKEGENLIVNLHLDQKKPVYSGAAAHSGEYGGKIVEQEAKRIKLAMEKVNKEI